MYSLLRTVSIREFLFAEAPALAASLFIAELFYKFHSFTIEAAAFLATWYALGACAGYLTRAGRGSGDRT